MPYVHAMDFDIDQRSLSDTIHNLKIHGSVMTSIARALLSFIRDMLADVLVAKSEILR